MQKSVLMIYKEKKYILGDRNKSYDFQTNPYKVCGICLTK